ncbi:MAG: CDP-alcohol phosphatidyltransferase family protein [Planctomycetota bacterium]
MAEETENAGYEVHDRRPMPPREWAVMRGFTDGAIRLGLSANAVSVLSVVFAGLGAAATVATASTVGVPQRLLWLAGAVGIELRAFCNLLDGMVAVKTQTASPVGELYNEVPDRLSDIAMLVGLGYAAGSSPTLGWAAATAAVLVAYVRAQGAASGAGQDYCGPMAKPVRMQIVALSCVVCAVIPRHTTGWWDKHSVLIFEDVPVSGDLADWVLLLILFGCIVTALRRLKRAAARLREGAA